MPTIREILAAPPQASVDARQLLRAIAEHPEWYVPMLSFPERTVFPQVVLPASGQLGAVPDELWLFSDRAAVDRSPHQLGFGSMSGIEVCAAVKPAWVNGWIDPGAPAARSFGMAEVVLRQMSQLARAVVMERDLEAMGADALRSMQQRFFIVIAQNAPVRMQVDNRSASALLAFTAADSVDRLLEQMPPAARGDAVVNSLEVRQLLHNIGENPIDGLYINAFGPRAELLVAGEQLAELVRLAG